MVEQLGLIGTVLVVLVCFNLLMGGVHAALSYLKDKTIWTWDNTADGWVVTAMSWAQKGIDMLGGNMAHKKEEEANLPPPPQPK